MYHIPACKKDAEFALLRIEPRGDIIDLGDNRRLPFTIGAREIADDLLQELQDHGVFVCAADRPSAEELATARGAVREIPSAAGDGSGCDVGAADIRSARFRICIDGRRLRWGWSASGRTCRYGWMIVRRVGRR